MVDDIVELLIATAKAKGTISYKYFYKRFLDGLSKQELWTTFEIACRKIAENNIAIYSSLMANKAGIPEVGFYDIYRIFRSNSYKAVAGDAHPTDLTPEQKEAFTSAEREVVYAHAQKL